MNSPDFRCFLWSLEIAMWTITSAWWLLCDLMLGRFLVTAWPAVLALSQLGSSWLGSPALTLFSGLGTSVLVALDTPGEEESPPVTPRIILF